jgi:acetyl esterase/lipase
MDLARVAPELRGPVRRLPPIPARNAVVRRLVRAAMVLVPTVTVDGVDLTLIDRRTEPRLRLRVHRPRVPRSTAALLWIHGGGLVMGSPAQDDRLCAATARELGIVVVAVEYRLAPRHVFPAALDDCAAGWAWLQEAASWLGVDPTRVAVGGQSAGGGLAASLVQRLHDSGGPQPAAQWLFCPMLDDRTAARRELDGVGHRVWNNRLNAFGWGSYLGVAPGASSVAPYAVPARRSDLGGLPPAWIGVGDIDLFHDEDQEYASRLRAAGIDTTVEVVAGAPHGFEAWAAGTGIARDYVASAQAWLWKTLSR